LKTMMGEGKFPQVSTLVDCMFIVEVKKRILTSGHDLDLIQGDLTFDASDGGEQYIKLNGREQVLKENDVILRDEQGILATVLYGPAERTSITSETRNALYFAWCPYRMDEEQITSHLNDKLSNLNIVYGSITSEILILQSLVRVSKRP